MTDRRIVYAAAFLRAVAVGAAGVFTAIYLSDHGFSVTTIGLIIAAGMAGGAIATLAVGMRIDLRIGRRNFLVLLSMLGALGYLGLLVPAGPGILAALAFAGTMNAMGRDRGGISALEQAILPDTVAPERRTWTLAWYNVALDAGHAAGALAGAAPVFIAMASDVDSVSAHRMVLGACAGLLAVGAGLYAMLSTRVEVDDRGAGETHASPVRAKRSPDEPVSPETRRAVRKLAWLFGLDSLGGGFLSSSLVALWFFSRYGLNEQDIALLFFAARVLNALSHLGAAWLAQRIGLVNTMVFTHLPSSLFLMAAPAAPTAALATGLFLAREGLVEMDVPTRQSYVMAIVRREERSYSSGVTNLTRNLGWAAGPAVAGIVMQHVALAGPLLIGGGLKVIYDLLLYLSFRHLKTPEERVA